MKEKCTNTNYKNTKIFLREVLETLFGVVHDHSSSYIYAPALSSPSVVLRWRRRLCSEKLCGGVLQTEFHPRIAQQDFPIQMKSGAVVIREWLSGA